MTWENGLAEAVERLRAHLGKPRVRFDARDRSALAYVLDFAEDLERDHREAAEEERRVTAIAMELARAYRPCPACHMPTLRTEGLCATCEP